MPTEVFAASRGCPPDPRRNATSPGYSDGGKLNAGRGVCRFPGMPARPHGVTTAGGWRRVAVLREFFEDLFGNVEVGVDVVDVVLVLDRVEQLDQGSGVRLFDLDRVLRDHFETS